MKAILNKCANIEAALQLAITPMEYDLMDTIGEEFLVPLDGLMLLITRIVW